MDAKIADIKQHLTDDEIPKMVVVVSSITSYHHYRIKHVDNTALNVRFEGNNPVHGNAMAVSIPLSHHIHPITMILIKKIVMEYHLGSCVGVRLATSLVPWRTVLKH